MTDYTDLEENRDMNSARPFEPIPRDMRGSSSGTRDMSRKEASAPVNKGEHIRGSDLKITESDVLGSLPFFKRIHAYIFGGVFGMHDGTTHKNAKGEPVRGVIVAFIPNLWRRIYFKYIYKHSVGVKKDE